MISGIAMKLIGFAGVAVLAAGLWFYVQHLQTQVQLERANSALAQQALKDTKATVDGLREDVKVMGESVVKLTGAFAEARKDVQNLEKRFTETKTGKERDIENLAAKHPLLIEKAINNGSKEAMRCNELVTGSAPQPGEKNSLCPKLVQQ
jgi:chromosome segregation ATPase